MKTMSEETSGRSSDALLDLRVLSSAFWWAWVWVAFFPGDALLIGAGQPFPWWATFLATASLAGIILLAIPRALKPFAAWKPKLVVGTLLAAVSFALYCAPSGPAGFALVAVAGLLSTVWGAWSLGCIASDMRRTAARVACTMLIAAVLYLLTVGRPTFTEATLTALLPLTSTLLARAGNYADHSDTTADLVFLRASARTCGSRRDRCALTECAAGFATVFLCTAAFGFFGSFVTRGADLEMAPIVAVTIAAVALLLWYLLGVRGIGLPAAARYAGSIPLYVLGLVALIAATLFGQALVPLAVVLVVAGWVCVVAFGWSSLLSLRDDALVPMAPAVFCILVLQAGTLCGSALVSFSDSLGLSGSAELIAPMALIVLLVLLLSVLALRTGTAVQHDGRANGGGAPSGGNPSAPDAAGLMARFGLSDREVEVCALLLAGHSLQAIADQMVVSKSTVATHAQHVYRKCGVHDRGELLALVTDGAPGAGQQA